MCNLLKAAVACLPKLSKSNYLLSCLCHWASVIDKQLSQQGVSTNEQVTKSHLQSNTAFRCHLWDCYLVSYFSTLFCTRFVLICSPRYSQQGAFLRYTSPSTELAVLQAAICTTQQAWTSIDCFWPPFLPFASLKLVPQWFISLRMASSAMPCPCSDLHMLGEKTGITRNTVLIASISQHLTAILKLATETDGILSQI